MRAPIAGAVVLITGGASGIGRLMAIGAADRGAKHVIIWDIDADGADDAACEIQSFGGSVSTYRVDLTDASDVARVGEQTLADHGRVDILINSAGIVTGRRLLDLTDDDVVRTFDLNVFSLYRAVRIVLPGMIARGKGSITTVASAAGLIGVAKQTDYSASKFAATGFMESLRAELRHEGTPLHTLIVQPFYIDTGMFEGVTSRFPRLLPILDAEESAARILDAVEAGRQSLVMPRFAAVVKLAKALPVPILDRITDAFGISATMDGFRGRS